jgi:hypothetical protein
MKHLREQQVTCIPPRIFNKQFREEINMLYFFVFQTTINCYLYFRLYRFIMPESGQSVSPSSYMHIQAQMTHTKCHTFGSYFVWYEYGAASDSATFIPSSLKWSRSFWAEGTHTQTQTQTQKHDDTVRVTQHTYYSIKGLSSVIRKTKTYMKQ